MFDADKIKQIVENVAEHFGINDIVVEHRDNAIIIVGAPAHLKHDMHNTISQRTAKYSIVVDICATNNVMTFEKQPTFDIPIGIINNALGKTVYTPHFGAYTKHNGAKSGVMAIHKNFINTRLKKCAQVQKTVQTKHNLRRSR